MRFEESHSIKQSDNKGLHPILSCMVSELNGYGLPSEILLAFMQKYQII